MKEKLETFLEVLYQIIMVCWMLLLISGITLVIFFGFLFTMCFIKGHMSGLSFGVALGCVPVGIVIILYVFYLISEFLNWIFRKRG